MRRREFISILGGACVAWPVAARAQQSARRIAMLLLDAENDPEAQPLVIAFRHGLQELGWIEGRNIQIDYLWGAREPDRARALAERLVTLAPDVVLAYGSPATAAMHRATTSIPVVFVVVTDPVSGGYVQSLARPGGNITGFSTFEPEIGGKWLELLKEVAPGLRRVAGVLDPSFKAWDAIWRATETVASGFQIEVTSVPLRDYRQYRVSCDGIRARTQWGSDHPSDRHQLSESRTDTFARCATPATCRLSVPGIRGQWRLDVLRTRPSRLISAWRVLRRSYPQGREGERASSPATDQVRIRHQPQDRQSVQSHHSGGATRTCRRADRVRFPTSVIGTSRKSYFMPEMSG